MTAPIRIRPWLVIRTDTRLVRSRCPLPQGPLTRPADCSRAPKTAAVPLPRAGTRGPARAAGHPGAADWLELRNGPSPDPAGPPDGAVPVSAGSDDCGRLATASQLWPITRTPFVMLPGCEPWPEAWLPDPVLSWVTVAPSGGLKAKLPMDGRAKDTRR